MSASAFAEAGEFDIAREILRKENVLLVLTGDESDKRSFRYALNISKRIGAGLEVLYVSTKDDDILRVFGDEAKKEGIDFKVTKRKEGCIKKEIIDYTEKRRDLQFVIVESSNTLDIDCEEGKKLSDSWSRIKCPLVVVSEAV